MLAKSHFDKIYMVVLLMPALVALCVIGCLEDQWEDPPIDHDEEPCEADEDETWQCNGEVIELCRDGYWRPWEDCSNIGGTCEVDYYTGELYCLEPPPETDGGDTDTETETDT